MIELEAKVRLSIEQKVEVLEKLKSFADFVGVKNKEDFYFSKGDNYPLFRVRNEDGALIVTQKKHVIKNGIETNEEVEFGISDFDSFVKFAENLGFEISAKKNKLSNFFTKGGFNLELCEVGSLGWFLEIEILTKEEDLEKNTQNLIKIFGEFGFGKEDFETKKYLELLG